MAPRLSNIRSLWGPQRKPENCCWPSHETAVVHGSIGIERQTKAKALPQILNNDLQKKIYKHVGTAASWQTPLQEFKTLLPGEPKNPSIKEHTLN